jgi:hypothetical protein
MLGGEETPEYVSNSTTQNAEHSEPSSQETTIKDWLEKAIAERDRQQTNIENLLTGIIKIVREQPALLATTNEEGLFALNIACEYSKFSRTMNQSSGRALSSRWQTIQC